MPEYPAGTYGPGYVGLLQSRWSYPPQRQLGPDNTAVGCANRSERPHPASDRPYERMNMTGATGPIGRLHERAQGPGRGRASIALIYDDLERKNALVSKRGVIIATSLRTKIAD